MAGFNVNLRTYNAPGGLALSTTATWDVQGSALAERQQSIVLPVGLRRPGRDSRLAELHKYIPRPTSSDLSGRILVEAVTFFGTTTVSAGFPNTGPFPEEIELERFYTAAGLMDEITAVSSSSTMRPVASKDVLGTEEDVSIRLDVYHRTAEGVETLLDSEESSFLTTTLTQYNLSFVLNANWTTNDRLLVIVKGINYGIPVVP